MSVTITKEQARKFLLKKHGLYGEHIFLGKEGIYSYIKQAGCIQYDPIDVCGKNHELVLQSRISNFEKSMLYELLYIDRRLIDWFDKNQAIMPMENWPFFEHQRKESQEKLAYKDQVDEISGEIIEFIDKNGQVCSSDLEEYQQKMDWWWAPTSLARVVLDALSSGGQIIISNRKNTRKFYELTQKYVPEKYYIDNPPNDSDHDINKWHTLSRISSVGMLHNKSSDALLNTKSFKAKPRAEAFAGLLRDGKIAEVEVAGSSFPFYININDLAILEKVLKGLPESDRLELIAPLDNLIWDRKIIEELFGFTYRWEIYTPPKDRKYGYYVLPILYGDKFIGRIELKRNRKLKKIEMLNIWWEDTYYNNPAVNKKLEERFAVFNKMMY